jgi:choline dehydrogenase-like flavoprotein
VTDTDLLVVGSGPVGSTFARVVSERLPDGRILMVDAGPVLTDPPGLNLKNLDDPEALARARELSQGPDPGARGSAGIPAVEGTITARQGTHLLEPGSAGMPAAAGSTCVGGMGAHWTCATPRPWGSERVPFIPADELDAALAAAGRLLRTTTMAFAESPQGAALRRVLSDVFDAELPDGRKVGILPVAAHARDGDRVIWTGVDTILEPLVSGRRRFELRGETLCRELLTDGSRVTGAVLEDRASGRTGSIRARAVVVAADSFRTPQLLWASGIRPQAPAPGARPLPDGASAHPRGRRPRRVDRPPTDGARASTRPRHVRDHRPVLRPGAPVPRAAAARRPRAVPDAGTRGRGRAGGLRHDGLGPAQVAARG